MHSPSRAATRSGTRDEQRAYCRGFDHLHSAAQTVKANGTLDISGISLADPSLPTVDNVTVSLTATHGTTTLSTSVAGGITSSQVTGNGTGSVTITASLAAINATLAATAGLAYAPSNDFNGAETLAVSALDTQGSKNSTNVSLLAVGPLTINGQSTPQIVKAGATFAVSGISLTDPSLPTSDNVTLTLAVADGTVMLSTATASGVTSSEVTGNGSGSATITAPLAAINATLAATGGLGYTPTSGFHGTDTLALIGGDSLGNNGTASVPLIAPDR